MDSRPEVGPSMSSSDGEKVSKTFLGSNCWLVWLLRKIASPQHGVTGPHFRPLGLSGSY